MPGSVLRFLRFYAAVIVMLVSSVLAFGIESVEGADFSNVVAVPTVASVERGAIVVPTRVLSHLDSMVVDARAAEALALHAIAAGSIPVRRFAIPHASTHVGTNAVRVCGKAILRAPRQT